MKLNITKIFLITLPVAAVLAAGCHEVDDNRIPALPVSISLADAGLWNTYGVHGFGMYRYFIPSKGMPSGFHYTANTTTGLGGVLLIGGMDPYTTDTNVPLAYDLSCPVERQADIRVFIDDETFEAVCPVCGSHYDVTMQGGAPLSGPAAQPGNRYGMARYSCLMSAAGGYVITR